MANNRATMVVRLRLTQDGDWYADRKLGGQSYPIWDDSVKLTPEQALAVAEAVDRAGALRAMLRAWATDAEVMAKAQEENLIREAGRQHDRLVTARERASVARLAAEVLAGPAEAETG